MKSLFAYKPYKGLALVALSVIAEFLLPGQAHRTGLCFIVGMFTALMWAETYSPCVAEEKCDHV